MSAPFSAADNSKLNGLSLFGSNGTQDGSTFGQFGMSSASFDHSPSILPAHHSMNAELLLMNKKLSQLSLDSNGNDYQLPPFESTNGNATDDFASFNSNHPNFTNTQATAAHLWNFEFVLNTLRNKLVALKQAQDEFQSNFLTTQNQYSVFAHQARHQLNGILQEMNNDLEQLFKNRMMELAQQQNHIEELLFRIEQKQKLKPTELRSNGATKNGTDEAFVNYFDVDFVKFVRGVIDCTIPCGSVRMPTVEPALIDRNLRAFVMSMLKGQQQVNHQNGGVNNFQADNGSFRDDASNGNFVQNVLPSSGWSNETMVSKGSNGNKASVLPANGPPLTYSAIAEQGNRSNGNAAHLFDDQPSQFYQNSQSSNSAASLSQQLSTNDGSSTNLDSQSRQHLGKSLQPKLRRDRMSYVLKFGEQGSQFGQFAEPSGVAVSVANEDIYIADANNHRIQVFDKWGKFKFHFGDGKLKFPNRVAISALTGEIVVSERPPVHQIQVYDKTGTFQCKFGSKHLRHPRGLCIDHQNRVIVVECKVMRVFIFNLRGDLLHSFDCSTHIQFPNAVAVSKKDEIYISDNRSHCVKVFTFKGEFLRQLGGQGITNYPIGVILNESNNTLIVVDNYNNLNVTIFRTDGQLLAAFESSVKHQQCLDVAPFTENTIVVTSKDLQVYIYRIKETHERPNGNHANVPQNGNRRSFGSTSSHSGAQNHLNPQNFPGNQPMNNHYANYQSNITNALNSKLNQNYY